jgi:hypothetical protein
VGTAPPKRAIRPTALTFGKMKDKTNSTGCLLASLITGFLLLGLAALLRGQISWLAGWLILLFGWSAVGIAVYGFFETRKEESKCNEQPVQETVRVSGGRQDSENAMSNPFKKLFEYLEDDKTPNMMRGLVVMFITFMMIGLVILLVAVLSIIAGKPL